MQNPQQPSDGLPDTSSSAQCSTLSRLLADQRLGQQLQSSLLPTSPLHWHGYQFDALVRPALFLSGDTLDYLPLNAHKHFFYLADVAGHGTASALASVLLQGLVRQAVSNDFTHTTLSPADLLANLNQQWLNIGIEKHATLVVGCIDHQQHTLEWSVAGHLPAAVFYQQGQANYLEGKGPPIGLFANAQYKNKQLQLTQPFNLYLFSDGIFELLPAERLQAKEQQLLELIETCQGQWGNLLNCLALDREQIIDDDVAILTLSRTV